MVKVYEKTPDETSRDENLRDFQRSIIPVWIGKSEHYRGLFNYSELVEAMRTVIGERKDTNKYLTIERDNIASIRLWDKPPMVDELHTEFMTPHADIYRNSQRGIAALLVAYINRDMRPIQDTRLGDHNPLAVSQNSMRRLTDRLVRENLGSALSLKVKIEKYDFRGSVEKDLKIYEIPNYTSKS